MNPERPPQPNIPKGVEMYFNKDVVSSFAELEQNEKNFRVAAIADRVLMHESKDMQAPLTVAELGGGAHPDRYHAFFEQLLAEPKGHIDWVDVSPHMLELAEKYVSTPEYENRKEILSFITQDILGYLESLQDESLDVAIMKYTIDHIQDLDKLFALLKKKLKPGGKLVSTIGGSKPELKSYSTNARFFYNGEAFPDDETRTLKDGDSFTVKFFNVSGDKDSGYLKGAETTKYFHSAEKIQELAKKHELDAYLGDWKEIVPQDKQEDEDMDQEVLVLTKA